MSLFRDEGLGRSANPLPGRQAKHTPPEISLPPFLAGGIAPFAQPALHRLLRWQELKSLYACVNQGEGVGLIWERILAAMNVAYEAAPEEVVHVPTSGPLVVVANHPYGGIEGIILAALLHAVRPDVKVMANPILCSFPGLRDSLIPIDPFGKESSAACNVRGLKAAIAWVRKGGALVVFPAGEVAHVHMNQMAVTDPPWHETVAAIIRRTGAAALPVYFTGTNGPMFQLLGMMHPMLRTVMLPSELLNKRNRVFPVRIGHALPHPRLRTFANNREMTAYLRWRTYLLAQRRASRAPLNWPAGLIPLRRTAPPESTRPDGETLEQEIQRLPTAQILLESGDDRVILAKASQIPQVLHEIGRLREIAFRAVGKGTGRGIDLDGYDLYYDHLFVWRKSQRAIIGAYRLGSTDWILKNYGKQGLYTSSLFHFQDGFFERLGPALELGRSFVRMECQGTMNALPLLWKGIGRFVLRHPQYKILFGPVSISNAYHPLSQHMMVTYLQQNHLTEALSRLLKPKAPFKPSRMRRPRPAPLCFRVKDVQELSEMISEIETDRKQVPILLKHYLKLGGTVVGFNVNRNFSHVLDSLIIVDLTKTERRMLERFVAPDGARRFLAFHQGEEPPAATTEPLAAA